jgi:hypothetical protein
VSISEEQATSGREKKFPLSQIGRDQNCLHLGSIETQAMNTEEEREVSDTSGSGNYLGDPPGFIPGSVNSYSVKEFGIEDDSRSQLGARLASFAAAGSLNDHDMDDGGAVGFANEDPPQKVRVMTSGAGSFGMSVPEPGTLSNSEESRLMSLIRENEGGNDLVNESRNNSKNIKDTRKTKNKQTK